MFFRIKPAGERRYLQIVENKRDGRRTVQRVLATLGRIEDLEVDGRLDTLLRSGARFCETAMLISTLRAGALEGAGSLRIGPPMVFGRLWEQAGCRAVIEQLAAGRDYGFPLERAIFVSVLHRLMVSGSDRACEKWLDGYQIDGADGLELHQLYRISTELAAVSELREKPAGTMRLSATENAAEAVLWPALRALLPDYPDIKVEVVIDYGLTDIVTEQIDAGVRPGETVDKDMIAVPIGPAMRMAVVGSPAYFAKRPQPRTPQELTNHNCINLRLPARRGIYAWEFEKNGRELKVRVDGQLIFNTAALILNAALDGFGLAYLTEQQVQKHLDSGELVRVLTNWCPPFAGYHLCYPSRRQPSAAFAVLVEALRFRPGT
jgi:DNA-binding transcriptional LysR family regulator